MRFFTQLTLYTTVACHAIGQTCAQEGHYVPRPNQSVRHLTPRQAVNNTSPSGSNFSSTDIASGAAFHSISDTANSRMRQNINKRTNSTCTFDNAAVRVEFRNMSLSSRKSFTDAISCLQRVPPKVMTASEAPQYPGVRSRHDEYVATHINYTYSIHMTADFLAWHRFFILQWERDLQTYCGYNGTLPYWDWALDAAAPQDSELFNGDAYSMGSNGIYVPDRTYTYLGLQDISFPPGTGGGCVHSGPFANCTVNLGPLDSPYNDNVNSSFAYNPRCLVRDFNPWFSTRYNTYTNITTLLLQQMQIQGFQAEMQGYLSRANKFGIHGGGHWLAGGPSTLEDFHSSPGDPVFFLHHAMIDRIWTIWQNLDIERRQSVIAGTSTLGNNPPSKEMTLDDLLPFGLVAREVRFGELMDSFAGPFCYRYE